MKIIKSDGRAVDFDAQKVRRSIERTGAKPELIDLVMPKVIEQVYDNMTTKELYSLVHDELAIHDLCFACRYNLRDAILKLGPAGFKFEKYVASVLNAYGWQAYVPEEELEGSCVNHEVDVIAEKDNRRIFIEAKFRNKFKGQVNLKDTMATWSRFLDLVDAAAMGKTLHFDEPWIVTNATFSDRARQFGVCKGVSMIGWNFPKERTFGQMVDHLTLYPITVIDNLHKSELEAFSKKGLMLCREVAERENDELAGLTGISAQRAQELIELCTTVIEAEATEHRHSKGRK